MNDLLQHMAWWQGGLCVLVGLAYAWGLYRRSSFAPVPKKILFGIRFLLVTLLVWLLWAPTWRLLESYEEPPVWVIAIDNSRSVALSWKDATQRQEFMRQLQDLQARLQALGYEVSVFDLNGPLPALDSLQFDQNRTDLASMLRRIQSQHEGDYLANVLLVSDGIVNAGENPLYISFPFKLHTLAVGDTTRYPDLSIYSLTTLRVVQKGNRFQLTAEVQNRGAGNREVLLRLSEGTKVLEQRSIQATEGRITTHTFELRAAEEGVFQYTLEVSPAAGELNTTNNRRSVVVEVIDRKKNILIAASVAHPDLKALRSALERTGNYDVQLYVEGVSRELPRKNYDLLIAYQLPHLLRPLSPALQELLASPLPKWWIGGAQTHWAALNRMQKLVTISPSGNRYDEVGGYFADDFRAFSFPSAEWSDALRKLPPLLAPYAAFTLLPSTTVLMYQRVGSTPTTRPLWVLGQESPRQAILLAEGLWHWRLEAYALFKEQSMVDELIDKTVQYLTAEGSKRRFLVTTSKADYEEGEQVWLDVEAYDEVFQPLSDLSFELLLQGEQTQERYRLTLSETERRFALTQLPAGKYSFVAKAVINGKEEVSKGGFVVRKTELELYDRTAQFDRLRQLAQANGGTFLTLKELERWMASLSEAKARLYTQSRLMEVIALPWLFWIFFALASLEWLLRKYHGYV
jgi:hypothetical protein